MRASGEALDEGVGEVGKLELELENRELELEFEEVGRAGGIDFVGTGGGMTGLGAGGSGLLQLFSPVALL